MTRLPLLALLAALPACHVVLPLGGGVARRDGPSPVDRGEGLASLDLGDGPVNDLLVVSPCTTPCPPGDDCDLVPQPRDPEPDLCNELLYEEAFDADPLGTRWSTINGSWSWSAGWLEQKGTSNTDNSQDYYWARADDAELAVQAMDARYLVETRLRLGAVGNPSFWEAGLVARLGDAQVGAYGYPRDHIVCVARVDKLVNDCATCSPPSKIVNPDLRLEIENAAGGSSSWPEDNPVALYDPAPGQIYVMQLWYRAQPSQLNCRLVDDAGKPMREAIFQFWGHDPRYQTYLPTAAGTVGFRTWWRAAGFDWIRVFRLHRPTS